MRTSVVASMVASVFAVAACVICASPVGAANDDDSTSALFGRGLNTASPPTNPVNHLILPKKIQVKSGGVVDFTVAGFHDIVIFKPGFTLEDLVAAGGGEIPQLQPPFVLPPDPAVPLPPEFSFLADQLYYRGINPAGGPLLTPVTGSPANGVNRAEPVAFFEKGTYLVICNIRPHLLNGMLAHVKVN